jgi:hypothetical protein
VVHETLRLRPTTPRIRRRAVADTSVGGTAIPRDAVVVLSVVDGNRDPRLFGRDPDRFDPDRRVADDVPRWGLSFGGGPHICPGRSVGGGFPVPHAEPDENHLYGLVALMVQEVVRRGIAPIPGREQEHDARTERFTRWAHYWVRVDAPRTMTAAQ